MSSFQPRLASVIVPCYNQRAFIAEAVASALSQDDVEVIVVDDGSTDGSEKVATRFPRVRWIRQTNRGVVAARNEGLKSARGEFVLFLDADDRLRPGAIAALRETLQAQPAAPFAYGALAIVDRHGRRTGLRQTRGTAGDAYAAFLRANFIIAPGSVLYRRDELLAIGGFQPGADAAADYDLYLRLARGRCIARTAAIVCDYRSHGGNMSARPRRMLIDTLRVHARHREFASTPAWRQAWLAGREHWREFYGIQVVHDARQALRSGHRVRVLLGVGLLALRAPRVLGAEVVKKLGLLVGLRHRRRYTPNRSSS